MMIKLIGHNNQPQPPAVTSVHPAARTANGAEQNKSAVPIRIVDRVTLSNRGRALSRQYAPALGASSESSILSYEIRRPFTTPKMTEQFQSYSLKMKA